MALNRPGNLFDPVINGVPGPSGHWMEQESTPVVSIVGKNMHNNVSVQTGEEFSNEFLQDRLPPRRVTAVTDTVQEREKRGGFNGYQNSQMGYEDLTRILGLKRMDSESASDTSDFVSAKGSSKEIDVEAYVDRLSSSKENGENGHGLRKAFSEQNCDRAGVTTVIPSYKSESPNSNNFNGSEVSDGSQSGKIKFLCSFGGKILPRPSDGRLRYVGGDTRIVSIRKNISWDELVQKTPGICNQPHAIKYQLPGEDLDALISVSSDEDLQNMIEEYHGLEKQDGSQRLRIFLIPLGESESTSSFDASTMQENNPDYQYVAAVNGMVDPIPMKSIGGQTLASEANHVGAKNSPFPLEINSGSNSLLPNKISESQNINISPTQSPPFSPVPCQQESKSVKIQAHSKTGNVNPSAGVNLTNYDKADGAQSEQLHGGHIHDHKFINDFTSPLVVGQNDGEFVGFSNGRPMHKERIFHSERPCPCPEDCTGLLSNCPDSHHGMSHAFSDSKLQESGRKSAYCSQDGTSPSSPLSLAKGQLSLQLKSGTLQETPSKLHNNISVVNPQVQNNLLDDETVGLQGILPNTSLSSELMVRNEATPNGGTGAIDDNFQAAKDNINRSNLLMLDQREEYSISPIIMKKTDEKKPFVDQDGQLYGVISSLGGLECKNELDSLKPISSPIFSIGSEDRVPASSAIDLIPLVDSLVEHPQNHQCDKTISELLSMSQRTANDRESALNGTMDGQVNNGLGTINSEVSSLFPSTTQVQHSPNADPLGDLLSGFSSDPVLRDPIHPVVGDMNSEPMLITPVNVYQLPPVPGDSGISFNLQKGDQTILQNPTQDTGIRQEISLLDVDFVSYPNQNFEKIDFRGSTDVQSNIEAITLVHREPPSNDDNQSPSVAQYLMDDTIVDAISPTATEVDSIVPESESEDGKALGDNNEFFSDAMIAEMEASIYGLQIIRNADLEELRELGSGTYGTVYHGKWRGSDVAIKRIKKSCFAGRSSEQERLTKEFWSEAQILSNLHHPNVVAFYGVVPDGAGGTLATVTEFMVNGSLRHVLLKKDRSLDRRRKLIIAMDAAFGMEYLHSKNIVHFDLKCDNLLVNLRDPQRPICKVGDFGLSRIKHNTLVSGGVRGTLPWMAPELLNGSSRRVSEKVDVFSFGISMWEILTGEEPYANMHCGAIIGGIVKNTLRPPIPERCDPEWRNLMEECWSPDPECRPSFTEITRRLRSMSLGLQAKTQNNPTKVVKPNVAS
ncbi:Mitogen-activated protein kinase kinase kinase [Trema orientale]|uniref:Mitogen-activated protein kinase kinase kinase n=1 Tax=Trema orientale TaxID=63057 RepID=A0A2P5CWC2_TREOI|nr:Mitogen-activated protein kinase kinase kinase [Trema orientale]